MIELLMLVAPPPQKETRDWVAYANLMPPIARRDILFITGKVIVPGKGYKAELVPAKPQGINPKVLMLDLKITAPKEPEPEPETKQELTVKYRADYRYSSVRIKTPDGVVKLEVQKVH